MKIPHRGVHENHGLFGLVVKIVAKRRPHLGFCLNSGDQFMIPDHKQVPFFSGAKKTG